MFKLFCNTTGYSCPRLSLDNAIPVTHISRGDAIAFTHWLSRQTGYIYRLLTEAEWEYLAKLKSPLKGIHQQPSGPIPVQLTGTNGLGIHGLIGNAWELVSDCAHLSYKNAPSDGTHWGSEDRGDCSRAVARGGSWFDRPEDRNPTNRLIVPAKMDLHHIGFRVAAESTVGPTSP